MSHFTHIVLHTKSLPQKTATHFIPNIKKKVEAGATIKEAEIWAAAT